jgi:hypothetical protein
MGTLALAFWALGCASDSAVSGSGGGGGAGGSAAVTTLNVTGTVVDFVSDAPVSVSATLTSSGLSPEPTISVTGADFSIDGVSPFSVFHLLSGAPPTYRNTYNVATEVEDADVSGVHAAVVQESWLAALQTAFGVSPAAGTGVLIGKVVDDSGVPRAGVEASAFLLGGSAPPSGPFFLDDMATADPAATQTSASGLVVFYDVPAGLAALSAAPGSGYTVIASESPVAATTVTLANIVVTDGELVVPTDVSFADDVVPVFSKRGCVNCHSGNSIGADLGNLALNGSTNKIYRELTEEISPTHKTVRVDVMTPANSLVLSMPSFEVPADMHPNVTFASTADADYLTLRGWISEGALEN